MVQNIGDVEQLIAQRRDELILGHEFMRSLEGDATLEGLQRLLPQLAFFTFAFQDMLKLARERCSDPVLTPIVRSLEDGDRGHDRWYVQDLKSLGLELGAHEMFAQKFEVGRRVAYGLISLIDNARTDHERLALLLTLEAAAREFFIRVPRFAARAGFTQELRYFGPMHLQAEEAHDVFEQSTQQLLATTEVPPQDAAAVVETVEKTFALLVRLATDLAAAIAGRANPASSAG
jgi:hypothetical protein